MFESYRPTLHKWLVKRLRDPESADDVAQEVFLRATQVKDPELVRDPKAYVFRIAIRVVTEWEQRRKVERVVSYNTDALPQLADIHGYTTQTDELEERMDLDRALKTALAEMPVQYQNVLLLCKRDGLSREEAARELGLSPHTVEKYISRARAMLAEKLGMPRRMTGGSS
jgi:RNA polymerase sigma-19 factor, ECF subfamily